MCSTAAVRRLLDEPRDGDAVDGEPPREGGEDAGAVLDARGGRTTASRGARAIRSRSRQTGSFWRKPVPVVPTIETMSATTALAVSIPPHRALERDLADRVALEHHGVERPSTAASGWCASTNAGPTRTSTRPSSSVARASSLTRISSAARPDVLLTDASIPSTATHSSGTREPNATVARIAIFAAASSPPTSSVGSASA